MVEVAVLGEESVQQPNPALLVLGKLVNFVLSIDVDSRQQVAWWQRGYIVIFVPHNGGLTVTPRYPVMLAMLRRRHNLDFDAAC
ncbi:hypothetical protein D3C76_1594650 [compost metagenome]